MPVEEMVSVIFAAVRGHLDKVHTKDIGEFERLYLAFLHSKYQNVLDTIRVEQQLSEKTDADLTAALDEFLPTCGLDLK